jgi:hypothetical protein
MSPGVFTALARVIRDDDEGPAAEHLGPSEQLVGRHRHLTRTSAMRIHGRRAHSPTTERRLPSLRTVAYGRTGPRRTCLSARTPR